MRTFVVSAFLIGLIVGAYGIPTGTKTTKLKPVSRTVEDDSDMLMEPNEFQPRVFTSPEKTQEDDGFRPSVGPDYRSIDRTVVQTTDKVESQEEKEPAAQNFYPYYRETPALGHSRPYYPIIQQQQIIPQQPIQQQPIQQVPIVQNYNLPRSYDQTLLGSGDFGVIRGGTFYQDNDPPFRAGETNDYYSYYLNGHGRPHTSPYFQKYQYPEEQFANFRDFADINTPGDPAYSHFVVVYANKNSTTSNHPNPKNIFEQLQLLDKEKKSSSSLNYDDQSDQYDQYNDQYDDHQSLEDEDDIDHHVKTKKISKQKLKLQKTKTEKKYKKKFGPKDIDEEPLLALS